MNQILTFITWNPDPEIFRFGSVAVRWYGVLFALGFVVGYLILQRMFKTEGVPIKLLDSLTTYMIIGTIIGARLGHCLFYEPDYYLAHPFNFLKDPFRFSEDSFSTTTHRHQFFPEHITDPWDKAKCNLI